MARALGLARRCSRRAATTRFPGSPSPATPTATRPGTRWRHTSSGTPATSSSRSSSAARVRSLTQSRTAPSCSTLDDRTVEADQVVVATGPFQVPCVPAFAEGARPGGRSSSTAPPTGRRRTCRRGACWWSAAATPASRSPRSCRLRTRSHLVDRLPPDAAAAADPRPRPVLVARRNRADPKKTVDSRIGRRMQDRDTLIGSSPRAAPAPRRAISRPRAVGAAGRTVELRRRHDARRPTPSSGPPAIALDHSWIEVPVFDRRGPGRAPPRGHRRRPASTSSASPGSTPAGSALLGWVKDDAEYIAEQIDALARSARAGSLTRRSQGTPQEVRTMPSTESTPSEATFPTETAGLPEAVGSEVVELADGDEFDLRIAPVAKRLGDATVRMLAYNGSIPGPRCRYSEGSEVVVNVANQGDLEATVHWHGLRLENRYDGTHETQAPIPVGESFCLPRHVPRPRRLLVPPAHPRGLRAGDGPLRQHPRRPGRSRLLAAGAPRGAAHARRRAAGGRPDRAVQPHRDDPRRHGPVRQRDARRRRDGPRARRAARRGGALLPDQHRQHAGLQRRARGRADEARRAATAAAYEHEEFVERVLLAPVGAGRGGRALRPSRGSWRSSTTPPTGPTRWPRSRWARSRPRPSLERAVRGAAHRPGARSRARERLALSAATPSRTRRSPSWRRWTWARRRATGRLRLPDAPARS